MSNKLTNEARAAIAKRVLEHRFGKEERAFVERYFDLAEEVYSATYSPAMQKLMAALPENFLPVSQRIRFRTVDADGKTTRYADELKMRNYHRVANSAQHGGALLQVPVSSKLPNKLFALQQEERAFKLVRAAAEAELKSALSTYTTFQKLLAGWPEVKPFVQLEEAPSRLMPVVQVEKLNETFKLPVKKAKVRKSLAVAA